MGVDVQFHFVLDDGSDDLEAYSGEPVRFTPAQWREIHTITSAEVRRLEAELNAPATPE